MGRSGFTALETVIATVVASVILASIVALYAPFVTQFNSSINFQRLLSKASHPLDALKRELAAAKAVYVDNSQAIKLCSIDRATGNRIYYFWNGSDLMRKSESISTSMSTSQGIPFVKGLDTGKSSFSQRGDLISVELGVAGTDNSSYRATASIFPNFSERLTLFYDGFECNTLTPRGWVLNNNALTSWALVTETTSAPGRYWLKETLQSNQIGGSTATVELPLNLAPPRVSGLHLQFQFRNTATADLGEKLTVNFFDGTNWIEVFKEDLQRNLSSLEKVTVDLSSYALNNLNRIRFDGTLKDKNHEWVIDEVEIFSK